MRTRISGRWVVGSDGNQHRLIENGCVVFSGNRIEYVGTHFDGAVDREIDAGDALIAPGFVDLDALFDLDTTVLGFDNQPGWKKGRIWATDYVEAGPVEAYSAEEEAFQHRYAMAQLLLGGITTALPIRSLLYREWAESYEENAQAAEDAAALGLRLYLGPSYRTGYGTVDNTGAIGIHWDEARGERGLDEAIRFVRDFDGAYGGLIRGFLQPDRIEYCTEALLIRTRDAGAELGCPVRLHCCQGTLELQTVDEHWGRSSLTVLHELDFLNERTLLPHGVFLGGLHPTPEQIDQEIDWLVDSGAVIVHCPLVMARHADILRSFTTMQRAGVCMGMGTDTWPPDFWMNLHVGIMTARIADGSMEANCADYFTAATIGGADALGRPDLGRLTPGALADLVVWDLAAPHLGQLPDPIQRLVLSGSRRDARMVVVDGRIVVENGAIPGVDLGEWEVEARRQYRTVMESAVARSVGHPAVEELYQSTFPVE
jgi:cytosine/adenosine deaminase-related metal-dependent hydrolase